MRTTNIVDLGSSSFSCVFKLFLTISPCLHDTSAQHSNKLPVTNTTNTTAAPTNVPCPICIDGLTVPGNSIIPRSEANGITCDRLLVLAAAGVRPEICTEMTLAEPYCCPPPAVTPCNVCTSGITVNETTSISANSRKTCGDLLVDANITEDRSEVCGQMKLAELVCCPAGPAEPCLVCTEGVLTENADIVISGKTCAELVIDALLVETSSAICPQLQTIEGVCCPTLSPSTSPTTTTPTTTAPTVNVTAFESCPICPAGITASEETQIGTDGRSCGTLLADANVTASSSDACKLMQDTQLTCCPTPAANPCPVCTDGITVPNTTAVGTQGKTCATMLTDILNTEADSDTCKNIEEVAGPVCCPPNVTTTVAPSIAPATASPLAAGETGFPSIAVIVTESPVVPDVETPMVDVMEPTTDVNLTFTEPSGTDSSMSSGGGMRHVLYFDSFVLAVVVSFLCIAIIV